MEEIYSPNKHLYAVVSRCDVYCNSISERNYLELDPIDINFYKKLDLKKYR